MRAELARLVGPEHVLDVPASSPYNSDAARRRGVVGRADAVVLPGSAQEAAAAVAWCYEHDVPIVPRGGGTGLVGGAVANEGGVVFSMERLRAVRQLEPELWRIHPEAGVRTADVRRLARENGLMFGPDPGAAEQSQIGGNVATNAGGPHALKYGVTGAWVRGLEAVIAPGELVQIGGWAAKDVSGYDLRSLMVGSEGTLGLLTAVRLRLLPAPEAALPLVVLCADRADGCAAMAELSAAGMRPAVMDFLDGRTLQLVARGYPRSGAWSGAGEAALGEGDAFMLLLEFDGSGVEAAAQVAEARELLGPRTVALHSPERAADLWSWRDGLNPAVTAARGGKVSEDVVFPAERLQEGLERFEAIALAHGLEPCAYGHGGDGNVHATVLVDPQDAVEQDLAEEVGEELFALVVELGGSVAGEHGVGLLKGGRPAAQLDPAAVQLQERVRRAVDPKGLFNPGKKLARLAR